jgi:erythromycin esterase-like protein
MKRDLALIDLLNTLREAAQPLSDFDPLLEIIGDARLVLIGEASHGTHEFYDMRARITQRLIEEKGFNAVAVEADWPDAYRVNDYVRGRGNDTSADMALEGFKRFPTWMWRNRVVLDFVRWLRMYNSSQSHQAGFYGLDLYNLSASIDAVIAYLDKVDPEAALRARYRYSCIEDFDEDPQAYGYAASFGMDSDCETEVVNQLVELQKHASDYLQQDSRAAYFYVEQNARLAKNAEVYYRSMFQGRVSSWNIRDRHMAEMLDELVQHLNQVYGEAKIVIWAHNSHLGDARATDMSDRGEVNLGQLVRERYGDDACLVGFSTYTGTVTAAKDWGGTPLRRYVRPALPESYEKLFHQVQMPQFLLTWQNPQVKALLRESRLQRAIGVVYRPETERISHYYFARLPDQFDAIIHVDDTRAVEPLEVEQSWQQSEEVPETFPSGI